MVSERFFKGCLKNIKVEKYLIDREFQRIEAALIRTLEGRQRGVGRTIWRVSLHKLKSLHGTRVVVCFKSTA